eukprot:m.222458 g.222458  ORF g.222458 m.222458 type:complete len:263 (-) comp10813_c0_seq2:330-1118(-)
MLANLQGCDKDRKISPAAYQQHLRVRHGLHPFTSVRSLNDLPVLRHVPTTVTADDGSHSRVFQAKRATTQALDTDPGQEMINRHNTLLQVGVDLLFKAGLHPQVEQPAAPGATRQRPDVQFWLDGKLVYVEFVVAANTDARAEGVINDPHHLTTQAEQTKNNKYRQLRMDGHKLIVIAVDTFGGLGPGVFNLAKILHERVGNNTDGIFTPTWGCRNMREYALQRFAAAALKAVANMRSSLWKRCTFTEDASSLDTDASALRG